MNYWIGVALVVVPILSFGAIALNRQAFILLCVLLAAGVGMSIVASVRDMVGVDMGQILPK
jgi:hypothetical protein